MDEFTRPKRRSPLDADNLSSPAPIKTAPSLEAKEPKFRPPEEVADNEILEAVNADEPTGTVPGNKMQWWRFKLHMPHGKKQWIIAGTASFVLLGGSASGYWFFIRKSPQPAPKVTKVVKKVIPPAPTTEASKLSGLEVPIGTNLKPVTAVMIENSPDARPQSGLKDASVIFEAIAEGGITRFNALFQDTSPDYVGPVRSLRPYYIDWFWPFDASIAHVGGAPQALQDIKSLGLKDLDQFYNSGSYDRITSRYAPHNVYTSIARLNSLESGKGFNSANFTGFARKKEAKATTPNAASIDLAISSFYYNVHYAYDATSNAYLRSEGGEAHKDDKSGTQLAPKVVVAIVMPRGIAGDGEHTDYTTTGTGNIFVFQDGTVQEGTWGKTGRQAQWTFADAGGKALAFNPGQTWISMVDSTADVTYTP
ncbi:hypothetical protein BH10PAT3_BH10PAT3_2340 [soil metagenome]